MKTLIILPGWGGTHETWKEFIAIARSHMNVVCIDLPCFGDAPCPPVAWGVEEYANFVQKKIAALNIPRSELALLGHSFGGQVAAYMVAHNPTSVGTLILSGPALFRPKQSVRRAVFGMIAKTGKWIFKLPLLERFDVFAKKILYKAADSPDYGALSGIKQEIFKKIIRQDLTSVLPSIAVPTCIVWGTKDTYVPVKNGQRAARLIPDATLRIIEGGKHGLHIQDPAVFFGIIQDYVG